MININLRESKTNEPQMLLLLTILAATIGWFEVYDFRLESIQCK